MDSTTTSTVGGTDDVFLFSTGYVSCMKVDGQPILPPLMTEKRREEMRQWKEQAIIREKELKEKRSRQTLHSTKCTETSSQNISSFAKHFTAASSANPDDLPDLRESRSESTSPIHGIPATSTPRVRKTYSIHRESDQTKEVASSNEPRLGDSSNVPEGVLRERKITAPPFDLNKSMSSVPSADGSSALSYDGDEEKGDTVPSDSDDHKSEDDNFASAASSTGTFVIRRSSENKSGEDTIKTIKKPEPIENYTTSSDEERENMRDPPPTVVRKPSDEDQVFTRKRPAKYFDDEDETTDKSKCSTFSSIPNYVPGSHKTSLAADSSGTSSNKFSPVPVTNFSSLAKSLANEFTKKFCTTSEFSSTTSTANQTVTASQPKRSGGSYDVRLSTDIPSSAEEARDDDEISNSSDKENIDTSTSSNKHVRKLSYTLATPSAALLDAVSKSKDKLFVQTLDTVPSAPNSVGIQSAYQTPEKCNIKESESNLPSFQHGSGVSREQIDSGNKGLSGLSLGHGKQAHMERFLGDQENASKVATTPEESPHSARAVLDVEQILKQMQIEHETQLRRLAEQHRLQELRIRKEFENEMEKLKEKFSSTFNSTDSSRSYTKASPNSMLDSVNNSTRTPPQTKATLSGTRSRVLPRSEENTVNTTNGEKCVLSEQSTISELTKSKNSSVFQFTGGSSMISEMQQSTSNSTYLNSGRGATATDVSGAGLSRLQSRMQLMSPKLFRTPVDGRSPLLKGLLFLDPLDRPVTPLRIPPKALEPHMKPKYDRISAAVKGFLTRRLLNSEKVQIIVQTIRDTVDLLLKLYEEAPASGDTPYVRPQDTDLHQRLIQQLTGACRSFHDVFFKLSIKERMAIIATDREKLKAKALRNMASPAKPNISNATLKSIERRMSHRSSPKRDNRKPRSSKAHHDPYYGSQSVKPKPIKPFNISPKRRRISYWDERNVMTRSTPSLVGKQDLNGNNFKTSSGRAPRTSQGPAKHNQPSRVGGLGDTFIVPPAMQFPRSALGLSNSGTVKTSMGPPSSRRDSTATSSNAKSISARSGQSTISTISSSSGVNRSRSSTSRQQPWNSGRN